MESIECSSLTCSWGHRGFGGGNDDENPGVLNVVSRATWDPGPVDGRRAGR